MKKIYYLYILVFLLEVCGALPTINVNSSTELRFTILFELFFAFKIVLNFSKFRKIIRKVKGLSLFMFAFFLFSFITISKPYFGASLIVGLRIILMMGVAFIPTVYKFTIQDLNKGFNIIYTFIICYIFYFLFLYFTEGHIGQRFFGPIGDSFGFIMSIFCFLTYVKKRWLVFGLCLTILVGICASLGALSLFACSVFYYHYKIKQFKYLFISAFIGLGFVLALIIVLPNVVFNNAYTSRFAKRNNDITSADASLLLRNKSIEINVSEMKNNILIPGGTGSASFMANKLGDKFQSANELNFYVIASLPIIELFRVIREWGVYGLIIYLIFSLNMMIFIHKRKFLKVEVNYQVLGYYFIIMFIFNMILFLPGSILLFLFAILLAYYIHDFPIKTVDQRTIVQRSTSNIQITYNI